MQTLIDIDQEEMAAKTRKDKQLQLIEALQDQALTLASEKQTELNSLAILHLAQAIQCLASSTEDISKL